ncbi:MAG: DUF4955 domain-containing protein, partial [Bacteroidota bacterium]
MKSKRFFGLFLALLLIQSCVTSQRSERQEADYWRKFVAGEVPGIADFSYAGYDFGKSELPTGEGLPIFKVEDFGAIPDDDQSDFAAIQEAIKSAEKAKGGIVLFESGRYLVNEISGSKKGIQITGSNVILRGNSKAGTETVLFMRNHLEPLSPTKLWTTPALIQFRGSGEIRDLGSLAKPVAIGDFTVSFEKKPALKVGDVVKISAEGKFLTNKFLKGKSTRAKWKNINEKGPYVIEMHRVKSVTSNQVTFYAPILLDMKTTEDWKLERIELIENCGFEHLQFEGNFKDSFVHHKNALHDGGFTAVSMKQTLNSWVRSCTFKDVNRAVSFTSSLGGTIVGSQVTGNGGHSSFDLSRSTRGIIAYCQDQANQWHGPNSSHGSVGSVILRFEGKNRGIDLHAAFPRVTLFDDCTMAGFDGDSVGRASHGGNYINLPNHLDGLVFWNFKQTALPRPDFNFWDLMEDTPDDNYGPLTAVDPILVGFQGKGTSFMPENIGGMESFGSQVEPQSLYLAQLRARGL